MKKTAKRTKRNITLLLGALISASILCGCSKEYQAPTATHQDLSDMKRFMDEFRSNPKAIMRLLPPKSHSNSTEFFPEESRKNRDFVTAKDRLRRQQMCLAGDSPNACAEDNRAPIQGNDRVEDLVDRGSNVLKNLSTMERNNLLSAELEVKPWTDDYWAIAKGILAYRYNDDNIEHHNKWRDTFTDHTQENPVADYILNGEINSLSPAEKYDLFLQGSSRGKFHLTSAMWNQGSEYVDAEGNVEPWMGICHGWAACSYMLPEPKCSVTLENDSGQRIRFDRSDIKGLGSLLCAKRSFPTRFVGGRCNEKDPETDDNGRVIDQACFDTNPATWHMALVNQIGISKRSFVFDATYDYEVWNQPVYAYSYTYYNVETGKETDSWKEARVKYSDYKDEDSLRSYRSEEVKYLVLVKMNVSYVIEASAGIQTFTSNSVDYVYDLELSNDKGKIVGGEWYSDAHPDFLWTLPKTTIENRVRDKMAQNWWVKKEEGRDGSVYKVNWKTIDSNNFSHTRQYWLKESKQGVPAGPLVYQLFQAASQGCQEQQEEE